MKLKRTIDLISIGIVAAAIFLMPAVSRADAFDGDARMKAVRSFRFENQTVTDVLEEISRLEGITLSADPRIAARHVVVVIYGRPLSATLNGLAGLFGWEWRREGAAPNFSYRLVSTDASRAALAEKGLPKLRELVADEILYEIEVYDKAKGMPPAEREQRIAELDALTKVDGRSAGYRRLSAERRILESLSRPGHYIDVACAALRGLDRNALTRLLAGEERIWSSPPMSGGFPMSDELKAAIRGNIVDMMSRNPQFGNAEAVPNPLPDAFLRTSTNGIDRTQLFLSPGLLTRSRDGGSGISYGFGFPSTSVSLPPDSRAVPAQAEWSKLNALNREVSIRDQQPFPGGRVKVLDVVSLFLNWGGFDVIADLETMPEINPFVANGQPVGKVLTEIAQRNGLKWTIESGISLFRGQYPDMAMKPAERYGQPTMVPVTKPRQTISLDGLAELLSNSKNSERLESRMLGFSVPWMQPPLGPDPAALRLWYALDPVQRETTHRKPGLKYSELTAEQKKLYSEAAARSKAILGPYSGFPDTLHKDLEHSTLRIHITPTNSAPKRWLYERGDSAWIVTSESVSPLTFVREIYPDASEGSFTEVNLARISFHFVPADGIPFEISFLAPQLGEKLRAVANER